MLSASHTIIYWPASEWLSVCSVTCRRYLSQTLLFKHHPLLQLAHVHQLGLIIAARADLLAHVMCEEYPVHQHIRLRSLSLTLIYTKFSLNMCFYGQLKNWGPRGHQIFSFCRGCGGDANVKILGNLTKLWEEKGNKNFDPLSPLRGIGVPIFFRDRAV